MNFEKEKFSPKPVEESFATLVRLIRENKKIAVLNRHGQKYFINLPYGCHAQIEYMTAVHDDHFDVVTTDEVSVRCKFELLRFIYGVGEIKEYEEPARKMTLSEIERILGYKVEIITED